MEKIMITGANGMIGTALINLLFTKNIGVVALGSLPNISNIMDYGSDLFVYEKVDLENSSNIKDIMLKHSDVNVLVHLACTVDNDIGPEIIDKIVSKSAKIDNSVLPTAVSCSFKKIIIISTHQVYNIAKSREYITEQFDVKVNNNYSKLKLKTENILGDSVSKSSGKTFPVALRTCPIYTEEFLDNLKSKVIDPKDGSGFVFGDGRYGYSFTHLQNLIEFICLTIEKPDIKGIYNICDNERISAIDIVKILRDKYMVGAVISKKYNGGGISNLLSLNAAKIDYRYNDLSIACANITYSNTKAKQLYTFRNKLNI